MRVVGQVALVKGGEKRPIHPHLVVALFEWLGDTDLGIYLIPFDTRHGERVSKLGREVFEVDKPVQVQLFGRVRL